MQGQGIGEKKKSAGTSKGTCSMFGGKGGIHASTSLVHLISFLRPRHHLRTWTSWFSALIEACIYVVPGGLHDSRCWLHSHAGADYDWDSLGSLLFILIDVRVFCRATVTSWVNESLTFRAVKSLVRRRRRRSCQCCRGDHLMPIWLCASCCSRCTWQGYIVSRSSWRIDNRHLLLITAQISLNASIWTVYWIPSPGSCCQQH